MRFSNEKTFDAVSSAATVNGAAIDASYLVSFSMQAVVSSGGSPLGALKVQLSNDPPNQTPSHWSDVTNASVAVSGAATLSIDKIDICAQWIRLVYARTSGDTATITAFLHTFGF